MKRDGFVVDMETGECLDEIYFDDKNGTFLSLRERETELSKHPRKTLPVGFKRQDRRLHKVDRSEAGRQQLSQRFYFYNLMDALDLTNGLRDRIYELVFNPTFPNNLYETIPRIYNAIIQCNAPVLNKTFIDKVKELYPMRKFEILKRVRFLNRYYVWVCREILDQIAGIPADIKYELETKICVNYSVLSKHFDNKLKIMGVLTRLTLLRIKPEEYDLPFNMFNVSEITYYTYLKKLKKLGVVIKDERRRPKKRS